MKVIYNIKVEKELTAEEMTWLYNHKITTGEELTKNILTDTIFSEDLLSYLDAHKLLEFNVEILNG